MLLVNVIEEFDSLLGLNDRHLIIEAHLIIEEYLDAYICRLLPMDNNKAFLDGSKPGGLSYEQKLSLMKCFLSEGDFEEFLKFPRMVQSARNKVAHDRSYSIDDIKYKDFYDKMSGSSRDNLNRMIKEISQKQKFPFSKFQDIPPKEQFMLLLLRQTIFMRVEAGKIVSGPVWEMIH